MLVQVLVLFAALEARAGQDKGAPEKLDVPNSSPAFYYQPIARGLQPVIMYLHGRSGYPSEDCKKWAHAARDLGWVVCPQGPESRDAGSRGWANDPVSAKRIIDATLNALREKYGRRVQMRGNVLVGFSEGAFVAMQVGLQDPKTWNRWLILGGSDGYIFNGKEAIEENHSTLRRVYFFTGKNDEVAPNTEKAAEIFKSAKVPVRVRIEPGLGHEVPADKMRTNYRKPLRWLLAQ